MKRIVLLLASLLLLLPMGGVLASPIAPEASPTAQQELPLPDLFDTVAQSVVSISVLTAESGFGGDFLAQSSGSGFVVDMQGHIVTNNHVVDEAQDISSPF
jgi:S1-C subfamily serine protease